MTQINIIKSMTSGESIDIIVEKSEEEINLNSTIIDKSINNKTFTIYNPIYKKRIYTMSKKKLYNFRYIDENSGIYSFKGEVIKRFKEKSIYLLEIKYKGSLRKVQRREFFRIDIFKKITLDIPTSKEYFESDKLLDLYDSIDFIKGKFLLKDISAGGIGFFSNTKFKLNQRFIINLNLNNLTVKVLGKVVRNVKAKENDKKYLIGVRFEKLNTKKRRKIINYVFNKQRELRKKGLI